MTDKLVAEYARYRQVVRLEYELRQILKQSNSESKIGIVKTVFERWFLTNAQNTRNLTEGLFSPWIGSTHSDLSFVTELVARNFTGETAHSLLDKAKSVLLSKLPKVGYLEVSVSQKGDVVHFLLTETKLQGHTKRQNTYKFELLTERVVACSSRVATLAPRLDPYVAILTVALRYESVWAHHRQWATSRKLVSEVGFPIEGMSSPFNAQCLLLWSDSQFCSLFPDVEQVFGSLGSFFETDFSSFNGRAFLYPPRVYELYDRIVDYCLSQCDSGPCSFALLLHPHEGNIFVNNLRESRWFKEERAISSQLYPSENPFNGTESTVKGGEGILFIISSE